MQEFQVQWTRFWKLMLVVATVLSVVTSTLAGLTFVAQGQEELAPRGASVPVYMEQGGAKMVVGSGGAVEVQSGGGLQVTPGATVALPAAASLGGKYGVLYATSGKQLVCGTTTITDSAAVSHGLTTPSFAVCSLNTTPIGDDNLCGAQVAGSVVTVTVRNSAVTPAANASGVSVNWCVIGTP